VGRRAAVAGEEVVVQGRSGGGLATAIKGERQTYFPEAGGFVETAVYGRDRLAVGDALVGPAMVEEAGSTLVVGHEATACVASSGNIIMTVSRPSPEARDA